MQKEDIERLSKLVWGSRQVEDDGGERPTWLHEDDRRDSTIRSIKNNGGNKDGNS